MSIKKIYAKFYKSHYLTWYQAYKVKKAITYLYGKAAKQGEDLILYTKTKKEKQI